MAGNGSTGIPSCLVEVSNQFSLITRKITTNLPSTGTFQGTKILLVGVFNSIASENPREHSLFQLAIANTSAGAAVFKNLVLVSPKVLLLAKWPCSHCHSSRWQQSGDEAGAPRCATCLQAQGFPGTHSGRAPSVPCLFSTSLEEPLAPHRAGFPRSGSGEHACGSNEGIPGLALVQAGGEAGSCLP